MMYSTKGRTIAVIINTASIPLAPSYLGLSLVMRMLNGCGAYGGVSCLPVCLEVSRGRGTGNTTTTPVQATRAGQGVDDLSQCAHAQ